MVADWTPPQPILDIYQLALRIRNETCDRVAFDLSGGRITRPESMWREVIERRRKDGSCQTLAGAGKQLLRLADEEMRPFVKRAVKRLCEAVRELGEFQPEYIQQENKLAAVEARQLHLGRTSQVYSTWNLKPESVSRLDELRSEVYVKLVELESLFKEYPNVIARVVEVAKRIAGHVLKPVEAQKVVEWFNAVESGERGSVA